MKRTLYGFYGWAANSFNPNEPRGPHGEWEPTSAGLSKDEVRVAHLGVETETEKAIKIKVPTSSGGTAHVWIPKSHIGEDDREKNHITIWKRTKAQKENDYHHGTGTYQFKGNDLGHADHLAWKGSADKEERAARLKEAEALDARIAKKTKGKKPTKAMWD